MLVSAARVYVFAAVSAWSHCSCLKNDVWSMDLLCLEAYVTLSQPKMTTLTVDNSFVGKMQISSISVQHQQWSLQINFCARLRNVTYQLSLVLDINFILSTIAVTRGISVSLSLLLWIVTQGFCCCCVCVCVCAVSYTHLTLPTIDDV